MQKTLKVSFVGMLALLSPSSWAVQGNLQSSSGYVASTVGGATVAQFTNEFDAVIDNPSLMQYTKTKPGAHKFSLALEYASYPNSFRVLTTAAPSASYVKGKLDTAYIPFIGYFYNINDNFKFGTGLFAIGGTGYNYSDSIYLSKGLYSAISVPLALSYKVTDEFNIGASLNLVVTQLSSNNNKIKDASATSTTATPSVGASYSLPMSMVVGADIALGTTGTYKKLYYPVNTSQGFDMKIGTPLQYSLGIAQNTDRYSIGFKFRMITWSQTENYKQLGWEDQQTYSLGGQYKVNSQWTARAGIYYVSTVYGEKSNVSGDQTINFQGSTLPKAFRDYSNALMYGIPQWQYAVGAGYNMSEKSTFDAGVIYEPEADIKFTGTSAIYGGAYTIQKKNSNFQIFIQYSHEV